jgi:hypothetical protein
MAPLKISLDLGMMQDRNGSLARLADVDHLVTLLRKMERVTFFLNCFLFIRIMKSFSRFAGG